MPRAAQRGGWGVAGPYLAVGSKLLALGLSLFAVGKIHEDGGGDDRRPEAVAVANRGLRDVARRDDFIGDPPDVLALVVTGVGVEIDAKDRREHHRSQVLGVIAGLLLRLAEAVMLGEVAVMGRVGRHRD